MSTEPAKEATKLSAALDKFSQIALTLHSLLYLAFFFATGSYVNIGLWLMNS